MCVCDCACMINMCIFKIIQVYSLLGIFVVVVVIIIIITIVNDK